MQAFAYRKTVLVVDGDARVRDMVAVALSAEGCMVQVAMNMRSAATIMQENPPDVVLLDGLLPSRQITIFSEKLTARNPLVKLILMTWPNVGSQIKVPGMESYLHKPLTKKELVRAVGSCQSF